MIFESDDGVPVIKPGLNSIDDVEAAIKAERGTIHLHLHGGLISAESGHQIAQQLAANLPNHAPPGIGPIDNTTSLFWIWRTGIEEVLVERLERNTLLRRARQIVTEAVGNIVLKPFGAARGDGKIIDHRVVLDSDEARRDGREDPLGLVEIRDDLDALEINEAQIAAILSEDEQVIGLSDDVIREIAAGEGSQLSDFDRSDRVDIERTYDEATATGARGTPTILLAAYFGPKLARVVYKCVNRFRKGRDHGLVPTALEEVIRAFFVTKTIWAEIKRRAAAQFLRENLVGHRLARALADKCSAGQRVVISAHSAGAILAFALLDQIEAIGVDRKEIDLILLAPAATSDRAKLSSGAIATLVRSVKLINLSDEAESTDSVRGLYPNSVLYLVSGALEGGYDIPLLGMERFFKDDLLPLSALEPEEQQTITWMRKKFGSVMTVTGEELENNRIHTGRTHGIDQDGSVLSAVRSAISKAAM